MAKWLGFIFGLAVVGCMLGGCDPLTVHKVTSTIFDGVPTMPPADQYCQDFHEQKLAQERDAARNQSASSAKKEAASTHPPYKEKRCNDCHDKSTESGLIKPRDQVCFVCHPNIMDKYYVHGPVSVGSCLECHEPHSAAAPALLKHDKSKLCQVCHKEKRVAEGMHNKLAAAGMLCTDCHDPHAGDVMYFLR